MADIGNWEKALNDLNVKMNGGTPFITFSLVFNYLCFI